jgi:hypothetical protein
LHRSKLLPLIFLVIVALGIAGCGGGATTTDDARTNGSAAATTDLAGKPQGSSRCVRLWNIGRFATDGERSSLGESRTGITGSPFPVLVARDARNVCLVVLPDAPGGVDTYSFERGRWADFIHARREGKPIRGSHYERISWEAASRGSLEEELEPVAETEPNATLLPSGMLVLHEGGRLGGHEVENRPSGGRQVCGTVTDTPFGVKNAAEEIVRQISCAKGMAIFHERWGDPKEWAGKNWTRKTSSGFTCESWSSVEYCAKGSESVELNYGV